MKCATVPIADPTHDELVSKAVGLQPLLRKHAVAGDAARRTADEVVDSLTEAGFFRLHTPRKFGGYEADVCTVVEITEKLGAAVGSAAWLVGLGRPRRGSSAGCPSRRSRRSSPRTATRGSRRASVQRPLALRVRIRVRQVGGAAAGDGAVARIQRCRSAGSFGD